MFMNPPESNQILVLAQLLYGYGYVGPFALEYEKTALDCGLFDYEQVSCLRSALFTTSV